jgi:hypothetical protein
MQHVSTDTSHHRANLEPLNIFEFLLRVLFVLKAADPRVSSGWPSVLVHLSLPAGGSPLITGVKLFSAPVMMALTDELTIAPIGHFLDKV